jgi:hypothetical protein
MITLLDENETHSYMCDRLFIIGTATSLGHPGANAAMANRGDESGSDIRGCRHPAECMRQGGAELASSSRIGCSLPDKAQIMAGGTNPVHQIPCFSESLPASVAHGSGSSLFYIIRELDEDGVACTMIGVLIARGIRWCLGVQVRKIVCWATS